MEPHGGARHDAHPGAGRSRRAARDGRRERATNRESVPDPVSDLDAGSGGHGAEGRTRVHVVNAHLTRFLRDLPQDRAGGLIGDRSRWPGRPARAAGRCTSRPPASARSSPEYPPVQPHQAHPADLNRGREEVHGNGTGRVRPAPWSFNIAPAQGGECLVPEASPRRRDNGQGSSGYRGQGGHRVAPIDPSSDRSQQPSCEPPSDRRVRTKRANEVRQRATCGRTGVGWPLQAT